MKAHVFALCLSLSLCLGLPLPALAFASPFTDVQETSPYYDAILWAAEPASPTAPQRPPSPPMRPVPGPSWPCSYGGRPASRNPRWQNSSSWM